MTEKVLIIKTSALGDIIQTFPVLLYLKSINPNISIDWMVEARNKELLESNPLVDTVLTTSALHFYKRPHYDVIFDLQGNIKSALYGRLVKGSKRVGFGWKTVPEWPNVFFQSHRFNSPSGRSIRSDYLAIVQEYYKKPAGKLERGPRLKINEEEQSILDSILSDSLFSQGKKVLVSAGSRWENKKLSKKALVTLLEKLKGCTFLFLWGTTNEKQEVAALHHQFKSRSLILERLSLPLIQHLIAHLDLVISMDSLPLHLAATTETPTLSFFGPSLSTKYNPPGQNHLAFQGACPYGKTFQKRCPLLRKCKTGACLKEIDPVLLELFLQEAMLQLGWVGHCK